MTPHALARLKIGIVAILFLSSGIALRIWPLPWDSNEAIMSACTRVGAVLAVLWLAFPQIDQLPAWILAAVIITLVVIAFARRPWLVLLAIPLVLAVWWLRPRGG